MADEMIIKKIKELNEIAIDIDNNIIRELKKSENEMAGGWNGKNCKLFLLKEDEFVGKIIKEKNEIISLAENIKKGILI